MNSAQKERTPQGPTPRSKITPLQILVLIAAPIGIFGSGLLPLQDTGTISNTVFGSVLITPANYVFIVWALIYLGLLTLAVTQILPAGRDNPQFLKARVPLLVNVAFNFAWLVAWGTLNTPLSLVMIIGQFLSAIWIFLSLNANTQKLARGVQGFVQIASGAYVAWLTLATVLNVACMLVFYKWDAWGISDANWTVIMMIIAAIIGLFEIRIWRNVALSGVFTWAFAGIALRNGQPSVVVIAAALIAVVFLVAFILNFRLPTSSLTRTTS
jgi:hypothetical protein